MAIMYPKNLSEYMPTDSERIVYYELKTQLPDSFDVFYSIEWTNYGNGILQKSQADFVVVSPNYGFICIEVKGGSRIRIEDNIWYVSDKIHGERKLKESPYSQAEKSMYYFSSLFLNKYNTKYQGIYGAGVIFPFYAINDDVRLDNRNRVCTIDCNDINNLYDKIKKIFRFWGGETYGRRFYSLSQNRAFLELLRERIAISAAAGALVKYKERQLDIINRVQDNYIYFLKNVRQFYIRGGAGTGKTNIAIKMADMEAKILNQKVLYLCKSKMLANMVKCRIGNGVDVKDVQTLFQEIIYDLDSFEYPTYKGLLSNINVELPKYDAIFVDEAQDFTEEWAKIVRLLLENSSYSRLGVFYDDVQVLRQNSFDDGFGINSLPYLLHENIRNTANIYLWTADKTQLGKDMIVNPVEGPTPITDIITEKGQLTLTMESIFKRYLVDENISNTSIVILADNELLILDMYPECIAKWKLVHDKISNENEISIYSVEEFKGLESDMVIYIHGNSTSDNINYIAYTRAKYYLIELIIRF